MLMIKKTSLFLILKEAKKIQRKRVTQSQKKYFKDLENEIWYKNAVAYTTVFSIYLQKLFFGYQNQVTELIKNNKNLYLIEKAKNYKTYEYLDEKYNKVVVSGIKDTLVTMSNDFKAELEKSFEEYIQYGSIQDSAELVYKDMGMEFNFNKFDKFTSRYLYNKKINWAKEVSETTEKTIKEILVEGYENGKSNYAVAEKIKESANFSFGRAEKIARTEILSSCNYASYISYITSPNVIGYKWSATGDNRTRITHKKADGQIRKKGEPFIVGGYKLLYPGDTSLGAPAKEVISCRCTLIPIFDGESLESNTVYDDKDVGTEEWLKVQDNDFQKEYLGGKCKKALFDNGVLEEKDYQTPWEEVKEEILKESIRNLIKTDLPMVKADKVKKKRFLSECLQVLNYGLERNVENMVLLYADDVMQAMKPLKSQKHGEINLSEDYLEFIDKKGQRELILIHNHPNGATVSLNDIEFLLKHKNIKQLIVLGHNGKVYVVIKNDNFRNNNLLVGKEFLNKLFKKYLEKDNKGGSNIELYNRVIKEICLKLKLDYFEGV